MRIRLCLQSFIQKISFHADKLHRFQTPVTHNVQIERHESGFMVALT